MTTADRILYHQIHPAKLATDVASAVAATVLFARHQAAWGVLVAAVPPVIMTAYLLRTADLEPLRRSKFGAYVKRSMTRSAEIRRLLGFVIICAAAWHGSFIWGMVGAALIVHAWTQGLLIPRDLRKK